jgi:hypothetical protein
MTIVIGWWVLPAAITFALFLWALLTPPKHSGDYGFDLMPLVRMAGAIIGTLVAWLIWSLLR